MNRREALRKTGAITGVAVSSSISMGFLKGCTPSGNPAWPPMFLKKDEIELISAIADTILPKTGTPGALDVHVPEFIDLMLRDNIANEDQQAFREGLTSFVSNIDTEYSNMFEDCTQDERMKIISEIEDQADNQFSETSKNSFYKTIKQLTILGFYSSEYVMNNMLDYHPVPGRYDGCIPIEEDGRIYVDNNV